MKLRAYGGTLPGSAHWRCGHGVVAEVFRLNTIEEAVLCILLFPKEVVWRTTRDFRWQDCRQENQPLIEYCGCIFNGWCWSCRSTIFTVNETAGWTKSSLSGYENTQGYYCPAAAQCATRMTRARADRKLIPRDVEALVMEPGDRLR